jgi:hypothetical protein
VTTVDKGPVDRIRVAVNRVNPLVTRAVIDLKYPAAHRVEPGENGVVIVFDEPAASAAGSDAETPARTDAAPAPACRAAAERAPAAAGQAPAAPGRRPIRGQAKAQAQPSVVVAAGQAARTQPKPAPPAGR